MGFRESIRGKFSSLSKSMGAHNDESALKGLKMPVGPKIRSFEDIARQSNEIMDAHKNGVEISLHSGEYVTYEAVAKNPESLTLEQVRAALGHEKFMMHAPDVLKQKLNSIEVNYLRRLPRK